MRQENVNAPSMTPEQRRIRQILRFRDCQARRRHWLSFWGIADWIACDRGATDRRDEQLRGQGYSDLFDAILAGEFDHHGRSCVLYLASHPQGKPRLSADKLRQLRDFYADTTMVNDQVLPRCWVPRPLAQRWFERRGIPWPRQFDPVVRTVPLGRSNEQAPASSSAAMAKEADPTAKVRGKPGPKPRLREDLVTKMLGDLCSGRRTPEQLKGDKLEALRTQYGGSPNTAKVARDETFERFAKLQK